MAAKRQSESGSKTLKEQGVEWMSAGNELIKREVLRAEKNAFIFRLFLVLAGYVGTTLWLNAIRQNAALWFVWVLIVPQLLLFFSIFVVCSMRANQCGHRHAIWLFCILAAASRVNDWELVLIPAMVVTMLVLSERNRKASDQGLRARAEKEMRTLGLSPDEVEIVQEGLRSGNRDAAIQRLAEIQEQRRVDLLAAGVDVRAMTPEIGRDFKWTDIVRHVFRVLEFDRAGTIIGPGDTVKAASSLKPYGYLLAESPIFNQPVRLPICHRDDFLLIARYFDEWTARLVDDPELLAFPVNEVTELLVTYVPKHKLPMGLGGISHVLHYVITPRGTLDRYYEVGNDMHMSSPAPEKIFGAFVWDEVRVQVNRHPEI